MQEYSVEITLNHPDDVLSLFGTNERHLKLIEENLNVIIHARTERVQILGDDEESVELARLTIQALLVLSLIHISLRLRQLHNAFHNVSVQLSKRKSTVFLLIILIVTLKGIPSLV